MLSTGLKARHPLGMKTVMRLTCRISSGVIGTGNNVDPDGVLCQFLFV